MADNHGPERKERQSIIESIKTPLGFFALSVLVAESVLLAFVTKAEGTERIILLIGMILIILASATAVVYLSVKQKINGSGSDPSKTDGKENLQMLSFEKLLSEIKPAIGKLQENDFRLAEYYYKQGDFQRLLDGLYSGILYAAGAIPTGVIDPIYYGNLMDWDKSKSSLRVRYFKGPYNDEIITRSFPLTGPKLGIASMAVNSGRIQIFNSMESELKERGEARLKAMISIPVGTQKAEKAVPGNIAAINIDSIEADVFPAQGSDEITDIEIRADLLVSLVADLNSLRQRFLDDRGSLYPA